MQIFSPQGVFAAWSWGVAHRLRWGAPLALESDGRKGHLALPLFVTFVIFCKRSGACSGLGGDGPIRPTLQSGFCSVVRIGRFGRRMVFGRKL